MELASEMRVIFHMSCYDNLVLEVRFAPLSTGFVLGIWGVGVGGDLPTQRNSIQFEHDGVLLIRKWVCFDMILLVTLIERINNQFFLCWGYKNQFQMDGIN